MDDATRLEVFRQSLLSRRLEERVMGLAKAGEVPASLHMGAGQEVAQIAALAALRPHDPMLYGHRGVGYWIARGVEPEVILCDIAYKEGGTNQGKGGPMHLVDPSRGVLGETGSLGGNFVIGVGIAFAEQYHGTGNVAVVFFGDGTANRGQFHEALNFAAVCCCLVNRLKVDRSGTSVRPHQSCVISQALPVCHSRLRLKRRWQPLHYTLPSSFRK